MSDHAEHGFNSTRIFLMLLALTAIEVLLSIIQVHVLDHAIPKPLYWGGLAFFALWKGVLIFNYFMHMKFEGWIVKGLVAPTIFLVIVILAALQPDLVSNDKLVNPLGSMVNEETGVIEPMNDDNYGDAHGAEKKGAAKSEH